jgi:hypothetical protein
MPSRGSACQAAEAPANSAKLSTRRMRSGGMSRTLYQKAGPVPA